MPYADSRVTDNLLGLKPGPLWSLTMASYCIYYIATIELRVFVVPINWKLMKLSFETLKKINDKRLLVCSIQSIKPKQAP